MPLMFPDYSYGQGPQHGGLAQMLQQPGIAQLLMQFGSQMMGANAARDPGGAMGAGLSSGMQAMQQQIMMEQQQQRQEQMMALRQESAMRQQQMLDAQMADRDTRIQQASDLRSSLQRSGEVDAFFSNPAEGVESRVSPAEQAAYEDLAIADPLGATKMRAGQVLGGIEGDKAAFEEQAQQVATQEQISGLLGRIPNLSSEDEAAIVAAIPTIGASGAMSMAQLIGNINSTPSGEAVSHKAVNDLAFSYLKNLRQTEKVQLSPDSEPVDREYWMLGGEKITDKSLAFSAFYGQSLSQLYPKAAAEQAKLLGVDEDGEDDDKGEKQFSGTKLDADPELERVRQAAIIEYEKGLVSGGGLLSGASETSSGMLDILFPPLIALKQSLGTFRKWVEENPEKYQDLKTMLTGG